MLFQTAIETSLTAEMLKDLPIGSVAGYDEIRKLIDRDPQGDGYSFVMSARRRIERQCECVFEAVPNVGIKKLPPREVINKGSRDLVHIRRGIDTGMRRQITLAPIEANAGLSEPERQAYLGNLSHFGLLKIVTRPRVNRLISNGVKTAGHVLDSEATLALFARKRTPKTLTA